MKMPSNKFWGVGGIVLWIVVGATVGFLIAVWLLPPKYISRVESSALVAAAIMMGWSAWQSRSLAYSAKERMEAESSLRRPYLNLDNWHLPDPNNQYCWRVNLKNFGNTPAYAVNLELKPRLAGYKRKLPVKCTGGSALIMPGQWNQWTLELSPLSKIVPIERGLLKIEFIIRYRSAGQRPYKAWELKLIRTPDPSIANWDLVGEDSEKEQVRLD